MRYAAKASACNACPLKSECTKNPKGRWLSRSLEEEYLERVRAYRDTEPYRKALRKRAVWVEPLFAEAKEWHGSGRFRLRRLEKVNAEALMIASGQNVKRLLTFGPRRPKRPAQVAALRRPRAGRPAFPEARGHRERCPWHHTKPAFFNRLGRSKKFAKKVPYLAHPGDTPSATRLLRCLLDLARCGGPSPFFLRPIREGR